LRKPIKIFAISIFSIIILLIIICAIFIILILNRPPTELEVKNIAIFMHDNNLYFVADTSEKDGTSYPPIGIAVFQNTTEAQPLMTRHKYNKFYNAEKYNNAKNFNDAEDYKNSMIFHIYHGEKNYYEWRRVYGHYYIGVKTQNIPHGSSLDKKTIFITEMFMYLSDKYNTVKIELEYDGNKYNIKKIGDYQYEDDASMQFENLQTDVKKGKGYFEEGVEYLLVYYPAVHRSYRSAAIPPVRFTIINGIPIIHLKDY